MEIEDLQPDGQERTFDVSRRAPVTQRPRRFSSRLRRAFAVLASAGLIAMACVACLVGFSWVRSQGAINVVQAQVQAIHEGKVEEAYALFSAGYRDGMTLPMFRRWLRRQRRLSNVQHLQFWGRSVWGETALLWGSFEDDLGHTYPVRYLLIREKGAWRVDNFQLSAEIPDPAPHRERFVEI